MPDARLAAATMCLLLVAGCGAAAAPSIPSSLLSQARPVGRGRAFHPPAEGPVLGSCGPRLGPRVASHVELFAANRVVLVATGIGTRPPRRYLDGRVVYARCYGALVTLDPTGVVLTAPNERLTVADLFRSWGQPLSPRRLGSFPAPRGGRVSVFVDGRRWTGAPGAVPLGRHLEIVLEVGPPVPPHRAYRFPPGM